ncbi:MAG TPA: phosphotransferase [Gemmatimonadales bacterium]|nr:phosphotransferase [Gemmatimonadales bacterium]
MTDSMSAPSAPSLPSPPSAPIPRATPSRGLSRGAVLLGNVGWHAAAEAWSAVCRDAGAPDAIEVLRGGKESATYRLAGAGPRGETVIAQRCTAARAAIERTIHEQVLPHVPVTAPRYHGFREDGDGFVWLFFEDVGSERASKTDPAHLALAGRWIAELHVGASNIAAGRTLPESGPNRYREHLHAACDTIRPRLANPALTAADVRLLKRLLERLERLDVSWPQIEAACWGVPATLTHGDFRTKNAIVRSGATGLELFPIDWETAGWGIPAVDLTKIDLKAYGSVVRRSWPDARPAVLRRLAAVGRIFLELAAINWVSPQLSYDSPLYLVRPMSWLRVFHRQLGVAARPLRGLV